jgi:hypothetical protein
MNDFAARIIHEDRMVGHHREADAHRLAQLAQVGRQRTALRSLIGLVRVQVGRVVTPKRTASAAASTRPATPSLPRMFDT